jgi:hypothetical protein
MLLISLIGEQPIPNLLLVRALRPQRSILVYTGRTQATAMRLRAIISGEHDSEQDLCIPAFDFDHALKLMQARLAGEDEMIFNLTGGTKMMAMAAFALAIQTSSPFIYIENEHSRLHRYHFASGQVNAEPLQELPTLIDIDDYLRAHLPGYRITGFHRRENGELDNGGLFEQAVFNAVNGQVDEVLAGVRPEGSAGQIELDLVVRCGNQVGIAEIKLGGGPSPKNALDQLKMAGEPSYLGTYTALFLVIARAHLPSEGLEELARQRSITVIHLPDYQKGQPLPEADAGRLAETIRQRLCA